MQNDERLQAPESIRARFTMDDLECCLIETADGSDSLLYRTIGTSEWTEPMHSSKGAWSETLCVYEPALRQSLELIKNGETWCVASIGLVLGYNELICAALALKANLPSRQLKLTSFESQMAFRKSFIEAFGHHHSHTCPQALLGSYERMTALICNFIGVSTNSFRAYIGELLTHNSLELHGAFEGVKNSPETHVKNLHSCVLFDAFSPESSPDLWTPDVLTNLVDSLCGQSCIFASYASRTVLKKILKERGFTLEKFPGFAGKRERTYARRF